MNTCPQVAGPTRRDNGSQLVKKLNIITHSLTRTREQTMPSTRNGSDSGGNVHGFVSGAITQLSEGTRRFQSSASANKDVRRHENRSRQRSLASELF